MRPSDPMPLADQALIRDWISQLAPTYESYVRGTLMATPGMPNTGVADDSDSDGIPNGIEYAGLQTAAFSHFEDLATLDYSLATHASGLTVSIQGSSDLQSGSWETLATRLRGTTTWKSAPGIMLTTPQPGIIRLTEPTSASPRRFYRSLVSED